MLRALLVVFVIIITQAAHISSQLVLRAAATYLHGVPLDVRPDDEEGTRACLSIGEVTQCRHYRHYHHLSLGWSGAIRGPLRDAIALHMLPSCDSQQWSGHCKLAIGGRRRSHHNRPGSWSGYR